VHCCNGLTNLAKARACAFVMLRTCFVRLDGRSSMSRKLSCPESQFDRTSAFSAPTWGHATAPLPQPAHSSYLAMTESF
jgi:hypothetical protein